MRAEYSSHLSDAAFERCRGYLESYWQERGGCIAFCDSGIDVAGFLKQVFPEAVITFVLFDPYRRFPEGAQPYEFGLRWRELVDEFVADGEQIGEVWNVDNPETMQFREKLGSLLAAEIPTVSIDQPVTEKVWRCLFRSVEPVAGELGYPVPQHVVRQFRPTPVEDRSKCVVLVPVGSSIMPACDESLRELERRGYVVRRVYGYAAIDQGRNQMAADALRDGFEQTMWIDSDIGFHPDAVDQLRSLGEPVVCGIYPQKGRRALACHTLPQTKTIQFGEGGGLLELQYGATGFLLVHRQVYEDVQGRMDVPLVNQRFGENSIPFFQPMVRPHGEGHWYLAEDYAFCERVRQAGYAIMADSRIRLWHIGQYPFGWENAGGDGRQFNSYLFKVK
ncbi:MAG: hypothetical protein R3C18_13910 [Planctomycetaceae bacterium]